MEGDYHKPLIPDPQFDALMPKPKGTVETIKREARLEDTITLLPEVIRRVSWQVRKIIPLLRGDTLEETCKNIWTRLYNGIRYCKDEKNKEQIFSPRATWWRKKGDCDDFSVFVSAILTEMKISHVLRIAMYKEEGGYQHIYPVAISPNGKEIIIDCVLSKFNKEVPYIKKIDKEMELQFLDGVDDEFLSQAVGNIDAQDLLNADLGDLGRRKFRDTRFVKKISQTAQKVKQTASKALHVVNRVNPATTLMRVGILASMKINLFNVAGALRYTYLSDDQARKKGIDMAKFPKLKAVREKLEKIFFGAGGKPENLRKAILTGHGNKNKEVPLSGLGSVEGTANEQDDLPQLLGIDTYHSETNEVSGLGEPATGSAIAAASSAMAALAAIIKSIGIFKKRGSNSEKDAPNTDPAVTNTTAPADDSGANTTSKPSPADNSGSGSNTPPADHSTPNNTDTQTPTDGGANTSDTPAAATDKSEGDGSGGGNSGNARSNQKQTPAGANDKGSDTTKNDGLMSRFSKWASENKKTIGFGLAGAALLTGLIYAGIKYKKNKEKKEKQGERSSAEGEQAPTREESNRTVTVSGTPKKKKYYRAQKQNIVIQRLR